MKIIVIHFLNGENVRFHVTHAVYNGIKSVMRDEGGGLCVMTDKDEQGNELETHVFKTDAIAYVQVL